MNVKINYFKLPCTTKHVSSFKHETTVSRLVGGISPPIISRQLTLKHDIKLFFINFDKSTN